MPGWSMGYTWNRQGGSNRDSVSWEMPWCCPGRQLERKSLPSASLLNLVALNLKQRDHSQQPVGRPAGHKFRGTLCSHSTCVWNSL